MVNSGVLSYHEPRRSADQAVDRSTTAAYPCRVGFYRPRCHPFSRLGHIHEDESGTVNLRFYLEYREYGKYQEIFEVCLKGMSQGNLPRLGEVCIMG